MTPEIRESLWHQFGAAIDMLEEAIETCPQELWYSTGNFWYIAYHTLFYLDYYLAEEAEDFVPPLPFTMSELDPEGPLSPRQYEKAELLEYLRHGRNKCRLLINSLNADNAQKRFVNAYRNYNRVEILLYNLRHVQHHTGQLNLLLRNHDTVPPRWVGQTSHSLE